MKHGAPESRTLISCGVDHPRAIMDYFGRCVVAHDLWECWGCPEPCRYEGSAFVNEERYRHDPDPELAPETRDS